LNRNAYLRRRLRQMPPAWFSPAQRGHRSDTRLHWHVPRGTQRRSPRRVGSRAARRAEPTVAAHLLLETSLSGKRQLAVSGRSSCLGNRGTLRAALQPSPPRSPAAPQVPPSPAKPLPRCTRPARPRAQVSWAQSVEFLSRQRRTYPGSAGPAWPETGVRGCLLRGGLAVAVCSGVGSGGRGRRRVRLRLTAIS